MVLHFSIPFLEDERHVNATYVHLPAMRMQSEEPTVENVTRPVTELGLYQPVAELFCLIPGGGGIFRIKKEIHTHLGVKRPFPSH